MAFKWESEDVAAEAFKDLRDESSEIDWVVITYASKNMLKFEAKGKGGLNDFSNYFEEANVAYAVLGVDVSDQDEGQNYFSARKHIFITWVGEKCRALTRAKTSQHRNPLYKFVLQFLQLQGQLQILEADDLTEENVLGKIRGTHVKLSLIHISEPTRPY
eukprot:TRINITY_DN4644_c0_g1_i2.p1 TRINITY_DN4644_c0_g1~~TRINITY_DN4644_c0_g1_i2.p1  ORF type:complete len:160 (-),score=17.94 TRINITY_DN4644_c0_g1_i2:20-499(-)